MKKYKNRKSLNVISCFLIIVVLITFLYLKKVKIREYLVLQAIKVDDDIVVTTSRNNSKYIKESTNLFYKTKRRKYEIKEENKEKEGVYYLLKLDNKIKDKTFEISIPKEKIPLLEMLLKVWRLK